MCSRLPSNRAVRDGQLLILIGKIHADNYGVYGVRKIHAELCRQGEKVAGSTVRRLMRDAGLRGISWANGPCTTKPAPETGRPRDLVEREFVASRPKPLWSADITYVRIAFVTAVFSRLVVGWQVLPRLYTDLVLDALTMGIWRRQHAGEDVTGLVHHSDLGVKYRAIRYAERLSDCDAVASAGSKGDSHGNAMAEALNLLYKAELIRDHGPWTIVNDVEIATAEYIDWFNNRR